MGEVIHHVIARPCKGRGNLQNNYLAQFLYGFFMSIEL